MPLLKIRICKEDLWHTAALAIMFKLYFCALIPLIWSLVFLLTICQEYIQGMQSSICVMQDNLMTDDLYRINGMLPGASA